MRRLLIALAAAFLAASPVFAQWDGGPGQRPHQGQGRFNVVAGYANARVYLNTATNTTNAGWQKVSLDTIDFDPSNIWDSINKRFRPRRPGYYRVNVRARTNSVAILGSIAVGRNGVQTYGAAGADASTGSGTTFALGGSVLIFCNGTTDYLEPFIFATSVGALTTGSFDTYMDITGPF